MQTGTARRSAGVDQVREALRDGETVARLLGFEPTRATPDKLVGRCPFHDDRNPSFALLRGGTGGWGGRCHGCGAKGDALALLGQRYGYETHGPGFRDLVEDVSRRLGLVPGRPAPRPAPAPAAAPAAPGPDIEARRQTQHAIWTLLPPVEGDVLRYLLGRGFRRDEIPDAWRSLPPPAAQGDLVERIIGHVGLEAWRASGSGLAATTGKAFSFAGNRLVLPWWSGTSCANATLAMLQRRRIDSIKSDKYISAAPGLLAQPEGAEDVAEIDPTVLVVVEGVLDAAAVRLLAREHGLAWAAIAIPGASSWRSEWASLGRGRHCVIGLDLDQAGKGGAPQIWADLEAAGALTVQRRLPMGGKDWMDVLAAVRGAA